MATNADYLRKVTIFRDVAAADLESFADACVRKRLEPGEALTLEGAEGSALYVLLSGKVRIEKSSTTGPQVLGERGPGEVIGEMALIDGLPRSARAEAVTECKLLVLYQADFQRLVLKQPTASLAIMRTLSMRLREVGDTLVARQSQEVHERLLVYLSQHCDESGTVDLNVSQSKVAESLGCARETVSRAFSVLAKSGAIVQLRRGVYRVRTPST